MQKLTLICFFCLVAIFAQAQQATEATVRELLAPSGANMSKQILDNMFADARKSMRNRDRDPFLDKMAAECEINVSTLIEILIPVYQKNYTEKELKIVIAFYETPEGKKLLERTPTVNLESVEIAREWATKIADKVMDKMHKEGIKPYHRPEPSEAEMEMMRADSLAAAQDTTDAGNPNIQKAEYDYNKEVEKATVAFAKKMEDAEKKRQKALDKAKKQ
jgi:uncharacterized protein